MEVFVRYEIVWEKAEFFVDESLFLKEIVMKAAYNFLDKAYFFFKRDEEGKLLVQVTKKDLCEWNIDTIIWEFSDEILAVYLRDTLEKENKFIRERIVGAAIGNSLDRNNFVENQGNVNQIDFDKDIDDILREIENDPELKIDEDEIAKILAEIEAEANDITPPQPRLDPNAFYDVKAKFQNK